MLKVHNTRRTLEMDEHVYELVNPKEPHLFRDIFSYDEVPMTPFNHRVVPMNFPEQVWITDTTFRDGQQSMAPFSAKQIATLYDMLQQLGGATGVIKMCEFFIYTEKDRQAVRLCQEKGYRFPEITAWIRAVKDDFKLVKETGLKETGILTSSSDYHIYLKLKKNRREALDMYLDVVRAALDNGVVPRCHMEDITRSDFYGFVVPFARELMNLSRTYNMPVKIRACDTMGYGVAFPGAALPRSVPGIIYGLTTLADVPPEWLEWHGHNDFYRAVNNASTAWLYGCCAVNTTVLGIGERTGNTPLEAMLIEFIALTGDKRGINTTVITEIAEYFEHEIGYKIPHNQPFVGANFNVTRAGIHADGLIKDEEIYNIFDTKKILNRIVDVGITDKSGLAGIVYWINNRVKPSHPIEKTHPAVHRINDWIENQYISGRSTGISDEEMWELLKKETPELYEEYKARISAKSLV